MNCYMCPKNSQTCGNTLLACQLTVEHFVNFLRARIIFYSTFEAPTPAQRRANARGFAEIFTEASTTPRATKTPAMMMT